METRLQACTSRARAHLAAPATSSCNYYSTCIYLGSEALKSTQLLACALLLILQWLLFPKAASSWLLCNCYFIVVAVPSSLLFCCHCCFAVVAIPSLFLFRLHFCIFVIAVTSWSPFFIVATSSWPLLSMVAVFLLKVAIVYCCCLLIVSDY